MQVSEAIRARRSVGRSEGELSRGEIQDLIEAATWAPNHHLTEPWTFTVLTGAARERLAAFWSELRAGELGLEGDKRDGFVQAQTQKLLRAPALIVVSTRTDEDAILAAEDFAATAAAVQNLLLTAWDRGFAAMWRTGDLAYHPAVKRHLGLDERDRIAAFIYLGRKGTVTPKPVERKPPAVRWLDDSS